MIVYLARGIPAFVMYSVNGESGSSLLIESTDYDMLRAVCVRMYVCVRVYISVYACLCVFVYLCKCTYIHACDWSSMCVIVL